MYCCLVYNNINHAFVIVWPGESNISLWNQEWNICMHIRLNTTGLFHCCLCRIKYCNLTMEYLYPSHPLTANGVSNPVHLLPQFSTPPTSDYNYTRKWWANQGSLFDFQKAFYSVPHSPLLSKLHAVGLDHGIISWAYTYFADRHHAVCSLKIAHYWHLASCLWCTAGVSSAQVV